MYFLTHSFSVAETRAGNTRPHGGEYPPLRRRIPAPTAGNTRPLHFIFRLRGLTLAALARDNHGEVAVVAALAIGAAHRRGAHAAAVLGCAGVGVTLFDPEVVHVHEHVVRLRPLFGVGARSFEDFEDQPGGALVREPENVAGLAGGAAADQIHDQFCLLPRNLDVCRLRNRFHYFFAPAAFSAFSACPLKVRVGANSPSLWPTMFSVMYTGMNFFPLCTASVWPTISGVIIERRDQVLWTFFSFAAVIRSMTFKRCASMNGPFLTERAITSFSV